MASIGALDASSGSKPCDDVADRAARVLAEVDADEWPGSTVVKLREEVEHGLEAV